MERNKNKVIHVFQTKGTLTPLGRGMVMDPKFFDWFTDWALNNDYCLLTYMSLQQCRNILPKPVINGAKYVFSKDGKIVSRYDGKNYMRTVGEIKKLKSSADIVDFLLKEEDYQHFHLYSHDCYGKDLDLRNRLAGMHKCEVFDISEWKDTVLYLKRQLWEINNG